MAPVSGVFPVGVQLHLLEIGLQAIRLWPYHAGLPAVIPFAWARRPGWLACYCSLSLSRPGKPLDPGMFPPIPPYWVGDITERLVAQHLLKCPHWTSLQPPRIAAGTCGPCRRGRCRLQASFRRAYELHGWRLDFRQSGFGHITRVSQPVIPYTWARRPVGWHAIVPFLFQGQVSH
jgi:hypothetical protein